MGAAKADDYSPVLGSRCGRLKNCSGKGYAKSLAASLPSPQADSEARGGGWLYGSSELLYWRYIRPKVQHFPWAKFYGEYLYVRLSPNLHSTSLSPTSVTSRSKSHILGHNTASFV